MKRALSLLLCLLMLSALVQPLTARAQETGTKTVRVGWFESPFDITDEFGRRSGYAYEYQQKIAAYAGWEYEYITGSWPELMEMLRAGRLDLMSDVSYTEERADSMFFSALSMGAEEYFVFVAPDNQEISKENYSTFNGKKVGVLKDSVQADLFREWEKKNGIETELIELTCQESEAVAMLKFGKLDMFITLGFYGSDVDSTVPVCRIGSSDFYFAVNKDRPDLLAELNAAMSRIQETNRYYNQQLYSKYFSASGSSRFLEDKELEWLSEHSTIRVGYQDNYLAFCAKDPKTGELTGALKEYLEYAADCLGNAQLKFEAVAYPSADDAIEAMKRGEVDCMFPANLTDYDAETRGVFISPPLMRTDVSAIVRESAQKTFRSQYRIVVAVNEGNPNYDLFLADHFPDWSTVHYPTTPICLQAVAEGKADCVLISNYRYNNIAKLCEQYQLTSLFTGVEMDYCFAVGRESTVLYSILAKVTSVVPDATVNAALSHYFTEDAKMSPLDFVRQYLLYFIAGAALLALALILLLLRGNRAEKKVMENKRLISATETDGLTGLYSGNYFHAYADRLYREHPEKKMDAVALNIERFRAVNLIGGRAFGDKLLKALGEEIREYLKGTDGIGSRIDGSSFLIYCPHLEDCRALYGQLQGKLAELSPHSGVRLRMGVAPWQADSEPAKLFEQARTACDLAGAKGMDRLAVFDDNTRGREAFRQRLVTELPGALERHELAVYYQPVFDVREEKPKLKSVEALVRWNHPELGMIMPGDFIPLFENSGLIGSVDKYVWAEAAKQAVRWREKYGFTLPVSVNLSQADALDPMLEPTLDALLEKNRLDSGALRLEITEAAYSVNADQFVAEIERLRKKGYGIELDHFGSGSASLQMLSSLPIDIIKLDMGLVQKIGTGEKETELAEMILGVAEKLGVPVIAVGVETENQLRTLKNAGCCLMQGYCFARPLPADELERSILDRTEK